MKLYYCPSFTGFVYSDFRKLMFNEKIVDTESLVNILKLHAGLCSEKSENIERAVNYYKAMKSYMEKNPSNCLKASFDVDGLSVAKECLVWRDKLVFAGWNKSVKSPSNRIEVICGVEKYFNDPSIGDEIASLIDAINNNCLLPKDLEIVTPVDYKLFSPLEVDLIASLKAREIPVSTKIFSSSKKTALSSIVDTLESSDENKVKIEKDDSFQILHFEEQDDACRYLSLKNPEEYKVWINSDNKVLDNWLSLEGKPVSGSRIKGGMPQITQILPIGLGILSSPLDLMNMIEWLNIPVSPLSLKFRKNLEGKIAKKGGYYNESCKLLIENFIKCTYDFQDLAEKEREEKIKCESKKRASLVEKFLPDISAPENVTDGTIDLNKVRTFTQALHNWCGSEIRVIKDEMQITQLGIVRNECEAVLAMVDSESEKRMSFTKLMAFVTNLKDGVDLLQYKPQIGCRTVISGPGQLSDSVESLVWCDFYNDSKEILEYDFLRPDEKKELSKSLKLWDEDTERDFNKTIKMLPFKLAEKITLVVIDKKVTEDVEKHPIFIQLEKKIQNIDDFIVSPDLNEEYKNLLTDVEKIDNCMDSNSDGLHIEKADLINWPELETYSALKNLVYNPFDYVFEKLAGISSYGSSSIPGLDATFGIVAHAVIETLFNKYENIEGSGNPVYIKENIEKNFEKVFVDMVNGYGAILLLKENILNLDNYKSQVLKCVKALAKLIEDNKLHVVACEPWLENREMNFAYDIKIGGYADMILEDEDNNPVVFDFKWHPGNPEKFKKTIKENKSIQLELYKHLTKEISGVEAKSVAYVVLPDVIAISAQSFVSENAIKVSVDNADEPLLPKLKNSYAYRRKEISEGFIEEATGFPGNMITYEKEAEEKNLIHLDFEGVRNPVKKENQYSSYQFFKTKK